MKKSQIYRKKDCKMKRKVKCLCGLYTVKIVRFLIHVHLFFFYYWWEKKNKDEKVKNGQNKIYI